MSVARLKCLISGKVYEDAVDVPAWKRLKGHMSAVHGAGSLRRYYEKRSSASSQKRN